MKILFLEIDDEGEWAVAAIGPAFIGAYLRANGHEVSLLRVPFEDSLSSVVESVRAEAPGLIGVSLTSRQWLRARAVVAGLRAQLNIPVVAGGLHPTFAAEAVLASPGFDFVCLGEGEGATLDLMNTLEQGALPEEGIANIWTRGGARPPLRPPIEPLEAFPFMARDLLEERYGVVHMVTQRGCPYPCTYCAARQFSDLYEGGYRSYGRRRSHLDVLEELETIRRDAELNYVIFLDDTFTIDHRWVHEFCRLYAERLAVPFSLHARVETVKPALLAALASAGCAHITYGVESGSERVRREIMKRDAGNDRFRDVFRWTREAGIMATANYIIGSPGETREDIEQTLALHDELKPHDFGYFVFYPYQGTALYHLCKQRGYLPDDVLDQPANHRRSVLRLPDLTPEDIEEFYRRFTEVRKRDVLARYGTQLDEQALEIAAHSVQRNAAIG